MSSRRVSLDWARGCMMVATLLTVALAYPRPPQLDHAAWLGVNLLDIIFPVFVLLSGVGLAFANRNGMRWGSTIRRSVTLLVAGLLYNAVAGASLDVATWRVTGPLASYAALVFVVGVAHRWLNTARAWLIVTVILAVAETALMGSFSAHCATGVLTPDCNLSGIIDPHLLGASHLYHEGRFGYDPEGPVSFLGLLLTASVGLTAGHIALKHRGSVTSPLRILGLLIGSLVAGLIASDFVEPFKRQWTPSFALLTAAVGLAFLIVGICVFDLPDSERYQAVAQRFAWPVVALGRNSLLMYFGSHALVDVLGKIGSPSVTERLSRHLDIPFLPRHDIGFMLAHAAFWWGIALVMHHYGIYVTASGINRDRRPRRAAAAPAPEERVPVETR